MGITFKSTPSPQDLQTHEEDSVLGFDDEHSKYLRDSVIRPRVSEAYEDTFHKYGGRMSEYELKKTMNTLLAKPKVVSQIATGDLDAYDLAWFGNKCCLGSTFVGKPHGLAKLKKAGIQRVIDLVGYSNYDQDCKDTGLEYSTFRSGASILEEEACQDKESYLQGKKSDLEYLGYYSKKEMAEKLKDYGEKFDRRKDEFIEQLIKFVSTINKGYVYMGCECGTSTTQNALFINSLFNPKFEDEDYCGGTIPGDLMYYALNNLYHNLTDDHKRRLGFTKDFEQRLVERIEDLKYEEDY